MFNQRGQIHIILLVLLALGFIIYANFSGSDIGNFFESYKMKPAAQNSSSVKSTAPSAPAKIVPAPAQEIAPAVPENDTAPPKRSNVQPKNKSSLPSDTRKITFSLETDEKAVCRYSDAAGVSYDFMQGKFSQTNSVLHSVLITTLSEGGKYTYHIRCTDGYNNKNTDDLTVSFEVKLPEDKMPPVLSYPSHDGDVLPAGTQKAVISISTNEPASCRYSTEGGLPYNSMRSSFSYYDDTKRFHVKDITKLEDGKFYEFFVRCRDLAGNSNTGDVLINFSVGTQ